MISSYIFYFILDSVSFQSHYAPAKFLLELLCPELLRHYQVAASVLVPISRLVNLLALDWRVRATLTVALGLKARQWRRGGRASELLALGSS
jgi:hypothetical protein